MEPNFKELLLPIDPKFPYFFLEQSPYQRTILLGKE